jgi:hypothetical protein
MSGTPGKPMNLDDLSQGALEPPNQLARIGRGMSDLTEPVASLYYGLTDPAKQKQYDAQRKSDEALYLRGLLGTSIPEQLRGAVPDIWRAVGQSAPFFALGPMGGLRSLTASGITNAAANTLGYAAIGQPLMYAPELWDYWRKK